MQEGSVGTGFAVGVDGPNEESPKEYKFFMPTTKLAAGILKQNQRLVFDNVQGDFDYSSQAEIEREAQDKSTLELLGLEEAGSPSEFDHLRQITDCRRAIAERLYHYLSSLAESPWALDGNDFPIAEYIPDGMATMLGLSAYRDMPPDSQQATEIHQLLDGIADEFRDWLRTENGDFITPWIEIHLCDNDALRLIAIEEKTLPEPSPAAEAEVGETYVGPVTRLVDFGAFVEIFPGTDGLLHNSEIGDHQILDVREKLKVGQQIRVRVIGKDGNKIRLSQKAVLRDSNLGLATE